MALGINTLKINEKFSPLYHHAEKPPARVVVLRIFLQVLGQFIYFFGKQSRLNFGRTGVFVVALKLADYFRLFLGFKHNGVNSTIAAQICNIT